jgi:hypothetical protein
LVVALLAAGADASIAGNFGDTPVLWATPVAGTADILQLLIDGGGSVNKAADDGETPMISLVRFHDGKDAAAALGVMLACGDLDLDAKYEGKTAQQWARYRARFTIGAAIAAEVRWLSHDRVLTCASLTMCGILFFMCSGRGGRR